jgi:phage tail sheath gpL-like
MGVDFNNSQAAEGSAEVPVNLLLIGQRISSGTVAALTPYVPQSADEVGLKSGYGSVSHRQAIKAFSNAGTVPITVVSLDDGEGTKATTVFTLSGTALEAGELALYIAGERCAVGVAVNDTAIVVATALKAAIDALVNLPIVCTRTDGQITLTAKNDGVYAGDLNTRWSYNAGEKIPAGLASTAIVVTPGTVDPSVAGALAVLSGWYNVISLPYTDATNMGLVQDYLDTQADALATRTSLCYAAKRDSHANLLTYGGTTASYNSPCMACEGLETTRLESTYEYAAGVAAISAQSVQENPAVPLHRQLLTGFSALPKDERFTPTERNQLATAGISTLTDDVGVATDATVTMYLVNVAGAADSSYHQQNKIFQIAFSNYRFQQRILTRYPRAILMDDSEGVEADVQIMTLDVGKTEAVAWFIDERRKGNFEGGAVALADFIEHLVVRRSTTNETRMDWLLPPNLANQFIVGSATNYFRN